MRVFRVILMTVAFAGAVAANGQTTISGSGGTVTTESNVKITMGSSSAVLHVFSAANSELLRLQSNGFLGVGTTTPNRKLDVHSDGDGITLGRVTDNQQAIQTYIDGKWSERASYGLCCNGLLIQPDGGWVAVGTPTPAGLYKFEVAGQIYSSTGGYRFPDGSVQTTAVPSSSWTRTSSAGQFTLSTPDHVGIGTTAPNDLLDVHSGGDGVAVGRRSDNVLSIQTYIDSRWADRATYAGGCCNVLLLEPDAGYIGIATSAPTARLEIGTLFPVQFIDLANQGVPNGYRLSLAGNGEIRLAGLQLGQTGLPVIQSTGTAYLNPGGGTVAIGTMTDIQPTNMLQVAGNALFSGTVKAGNVQANYQDLAEWVPASEELAAGMVVILDKRSENTVKASTRAYDTAVAGVVSAQPGIILGEESETKEQIATTGRVRVRVDATQGPIEIGDLLVSSPLPGMAMKSVPVEVAGVTMHRPGTIIGKALQSLKTGQGEILVLLSLQ